MDAVNRVMSEVSEDGRTGQVLYALAVFCHTQAPQLSTVEGMQALGVTIQQLREKEEQQ